MTETDDKLLKQFFGEQKQEIEDNGFSRRVMRNLPGRNHRLVQAWGAACAVVCVILFFIWVAPALRYSTFEGICAIIPHQETKVAHHQRPCFLLFHPAAYSV